MASQVLEDRLGVVGKRICGRPVVPSSSVFEVLGKIPVVERRHAPDAVCMELLAEVDVVLKPLLVDRSISVYDDPWPGDGESVRLEAELGHEGNVLLVSMILVGCESSVITPHDGPKLVGEGIPDGRDSSIFGDGALYLVARGGAAPEKITVEV